MLVPYKVPIYQHWSSQVDTRILISGNEDNRLWNQRELAFGLDVKRSFGRTWKWVERDDVGQAFQTRYVHVAPGFFWDLLRFRPDAIVTSELGFRTALAVVTGLILRSPTWVWVEATQHSERNRVRWKKLLRRLLYVPLVKHWISCGSEATAYLKSIGARHDQIVQVQLATDAAPFSSAKDPYPMVLNYPRILLVGQLVSGKGIYQLLDALQAMRSEGRNFSLVVIGDGLEREPFLARAKEITEGQVQHFSYIPPEELPMFYRVCSFLVFPTLQDVWGLVVNEAILSGIPVISSIYAGCTADLVPEEYRFDPLDQSQFTDRIRKALAGEIAPIDRSCLKSSEWIADKILDDIIRTKSTCHT